MNIEYKYFEQYYWGNRIHYKGYRLNRQRKNTWEFYDVYGSLIEKKFYL